LLGDPPFDAETPLAILMKHVNDPLPLPRQVDPSIPAPLERVVLKALAKRSDDRYQSAEEMVGALRAAGEEAGLALPERISLPLSFTTAEAPSESVAVLSGSARQKPLAVERAGEDTDATLGQKLAAEAVAAGGAISPGGAPVAEAAPEPAAPARAAKAVARSERSAARASRRATADAPAPNNVAQAALKGVSLLLFGNLIAIFVGLVTGWWGIYGRGWPFELLLVGLLLSLLMESLGSIWLLIPVGIVLGNGYLMSFYAITDTWPWWSFLWPLEPLLVAGAIIIPIRLAPERERAERIARQIARAVWRPSLVLAALVALLGAIVGS
jgi:hypothetical protein